MAAAATELGCAAVILARTELPLILPAAESDVLVDATEALAFACLHSTH